MEDRKIKPLISTSAFAGYETILNSMDDMVRVIDQRGVVVYANTAMMQLCGADPTGYSCIDGNAPWIPHSISSSTFVTKNAVLSELCLKGHVFSVKSTPLFSEHREVIGAVEVFRDITIQNNITSELFEANRKMKQDIHLARSIQSGMLPRLTDFGPIHFDYRYIPSDQLSGDIFDLIPLGKGRMALYIADVVGHGVSASILTMFVRQTMRSILDEGKAYRPADVLSGLRDRFEEIDLDDSQYFSLFYALLDTMEQKLIYANAGHNCPPLVFREGQVEFLECTGRLISNVFPRIPYEEHELPLLTGNKFLFYTDGVIESENQDGIPYGPEGLVRIISQSQGDLLDAILNDVNAYRWGVQGDDIALLLMETPKADGYRPI